MNLVARPTGGIMSDLLGSRRTTLTTLIIGLLVGYVLLSTLGEAWPWALAIVACMFCSFFVQAGEGAVYAIVPLVKKRVSGQIAGMAGAFGNVGAISFLTIGIFVSDRVFFLTIAAAAVVALVASRFLVEPADSFATELLTDDPAATESARQAVDVATADVATADQPGSEAQNGVEHAVLVEPTHEVEPAVLATLADEVEPAAMIVPSDVAESSDETSPVAT